MKCEIWDTATDRLIRVDDNAVPVCGEDFCDNCGDCLACAEIGETCHASKDGQHRWIRYVTPSGEKLRTPDQDLWSRMYLDQHPHHGVGIPGYHFCATYTPWGIQLLDSRFCHDIVQARTLEDCASIAKRLREDCHLHRIIRTNLYSNLHRTVRHLQGVDRVG